jgi:HSP90 family molecular chaperone
VLPQAGIYYVTGESKRAVENSPFLERLRKKGYVGHKNVIKKFINNIIKCVLCKGPRRENVKELLKSWKT